MPHKDKTLRLEYEQRRRVVKRDQIRTTKRAYYLANRDKIRVKDAAYDLKHKEQRAAYAVKYREANREKHRRYDIENRDRFAIRRATKYKLNPEPHRNRDRTKRAVKKGATIGNVSLISKWHQSWKRLKSIRCYWCKSSFPSKICQTDHIIPLARGGSHAIENLCISCPTCNASKHAKPLSTWNTQLREPVLL